MQSQNVPEIITNPLHQKLLIATVSAGMLLDGLDGSIVNIILPQICRTFSIDAGSVSWVVITYLLMGAGLILIFGKIAERGFLRRVFSGGVIVFTIGSAACGLSPDYGILLAARILQGIGASMMAATAPLLCVTYLPRNMLGMSLGAITVTCSVGAAAGPAIGGFLTHYLSWNWVFFINIPIGLLVLPLALRVIPKDLPQAKQPFDLIGAVTLFGLMASGIFVMERIPHLGITDPQMLVCTAICIACTLVFLARELKCKTPLINVRVFTRWQFTAVLLALLIMNVVPFGVFYLLPFFLTAGMHFDTLTMGLYLLITPVISAIIGIPFGKWSDRIGRRPFAIAACLVLLAASCIYLVMTPEMGPVPLAVSLILMGFFWGIAGGPASSRVVDNAPEGEEGTGSSLMVTILYLGCVIGIALYAMAFTFTTSGNGIVAFADLPLGTFMTGFHFSMLIGLVLSIAALVLSAIVREKKGPPQQAGSSKAN